VLLEKLARRRVAVDVALVDIYVSLVQKTSGIAARRSRGLPVEGRLDHEVHFIRMSKAVVLLSGGLDSYTAGAMARASGADLYALTFRYGQTHHREVAAAERTARALGAARHLILDLDLAAIGGSSLTGHGSVPKDQPTPGEAIPSTYVPARNTIFLSVALGWAEVVAAETIVIGINAVDYSGYPDCRQEYLEAFARMAALATRAGVTGRTITIDAPLLRLSKAEIIRRGLTLGLDYSLTHSCYDPDPDGAPCGRCDSCRLRALGFAEAGVPDPLIDSRVRP
jgi:7-cyano-7-deazaguanine synthase